MATSAQITRLLPRHIEIMNRLILGQKETDIARDLGMSISRVSVIVNSPLFQLELKRQLQRRQRRILDIEDTIIEASEVGANLMKSTITNPNVPLPIRVEVSNKLLTHLFGRIVRQMPTVEGETSTDDPDSLPYEKRLEREITVRETLYTKSKPTPTLTPTPTPNDANDANDGDDTKLFDSIDESLGTIPSDDLIDDDIDVDDDIDIDPTLSDAIDSEDIDNGDGDDGD